MRTLRFGVEADMVFVTLAAEHADQREDNESRTQRKHEGGV